MAYTDSHVQLASHTEHSCTFHGFLRISNRPSSKHHAHRLLSVHLVQYAVGINRPFFYYSISDRLLLKFSSDRFGFNDSLTSVYMNRAKLETSGADKYQQFRRH